MFKISVLTCTKNSEDTILDTIRSVKAQNYINYEQIFVDGGSTDKTLEICAAAFNSKIFIKPELNLYEALNFGLSKCSGDIIYILHSDDQIIYDELFTKILEIFAKLNVDVIYSNIIMKRKGKLFRKWNSKKLEKSDIENFIFPAHTSLFYNKKVFKKIGLFNTKYKIASDFDYLVRLFGNSEIKKYFFDKTTLSMNYGGLSTKSIKNILFQNYENLKIIKKKNSNILKIITIFSYKIINRINQFLKK